MKPELMHLKPIDIIVFCAYLVAVMALGFLAMRKVISTKRDYFLAGDKLPWWMVGGSIIASNISSHHFVGIMGVAYTRGFAAMALSWGAIFLGFAALLWIFLPFYLRNGFYTMPEYLDRRFGPQARTAFALLIFLTYIFVEISAVLYLGALVFHSMFPSFPIVASIIVIAAFTGLYTIVGGLRAVVWTEMFQLAVLTVGGTVLSVLTIRAVGGLGAVMATSPSWHLIYPATDPDFPWTMYLGGLTCISIFYCAANQFIVQRTLAAKDEWHARMGVVFTCYLNFFMPFIYIVPGMVAPLLFPNLAKGDLAFPTLVQNLLPAGLVGLVMAGLIAAVMSHISGAVNACTTIAAIDLYIPFINKKATERQVVRFGRIVGVIIILLAIFWAAVMVAHGNKPIFIYLLNVYGYFTPGIATMFLLGILWRRTTHVGALVGGIATIPLTIALELIVPRIHHHWAAYLMPPMNRTGIVFWLCMLIAIVVSLCTKPKPDSELVGLIWTVDSLRLPVGLREKMRGVRNPALWYGIILAIVIFMYVRYR